MKCFHFLQTELGLRAKEFSPQAQEHLEACASCSQRQQQATQILDRVRTIAQSELPQYIKRSPLSAPLPKLEFARLGKSKWDRLPWYLRTLFESSLIVSLVLLGITAGPKLRRVYEKSVEENLRDLGELLSFEDSRGLQNLPLSRGLPQAEGILANPDRASRALEEGGDEFSTEEDSEGLEMTEEEVSQPNPSDKSGKLPLKVGKSEIWRFNLRTSSPHELRTQVVDILLRLKMPRNTPGLGGIEAPGGIQFDLTLPSAVVPLLKEELEKIAPPPLSPPQEDQVNPTLNETFTWFKNKSKSPLPPEQTHVVIWLSLQ